MTRAIPSHMDPDGRLWKLHTSWMLFAEAAFQPCCHGLRHRHWASQCGFSPLFPLKPPRTSSSSRQANVPFAGRGRIDREPVKKRARGQRIYHRFSKLQRTLTGRLLCRGVHSPRGSLRRLGYKLDVVVRCEDDHLSSLVIFMG
jgi:hypothetical protein